MLKNSFLYSFVGTDEYLLYLGYATLNVRELSSPDCRIYRYFYVMRYFVSRSILFELTSELNRKRSSISLIKLLKQLGNMKNIIINIIGILLIAACSSTVNANLVDGEVNVETDAAVKLDTGADSLPLEDDDTTESQIESPENAALSGPEMEHKNHSDDEVFIDTDVNSKLDDSLVESITEPKIDSKKIESCLLDVSKNLKDLQVPNKVENLANSIRSLNTNLSSQHLTDLIVDKRVSLDVHKAGFVKDDEMDLYVQECSEFVEKFLGIVGSSECGDNFMNIISPHNEKNYKIIMEKHDDVDKMVGYTEACFIL